ncbi:MAG: hypothetical protein ACREOE_07890 [Gemmatimonadales bacterium]
MTPLPRAVARSLLAFVTRHSDPVSRQWGEAMLAELDGIEGEWAAVRWAWGGAGVVVRHSVRRAQPSRRTAVLAAAVAGLLCIALLRRSLRETRPVLWANAAASAPWTRPSR